MKKTFLAILFIVISWRFYQLSLGYDEARTHPDLTASAVKRSVLKNYPSQNLGLSKNYDSMINGKSIIERIMAGATDEDLPMCRASNHFHNPLLSWDQSRLNDSAGFAGWAIHTWCVNNDWLDANRKSALTWATGYESYEGPVVSRTNQDMGWDNARSYFYSAMTAPTTTDEKYNSLRPFRLWDR